MIRKIYILAGGQSTRMGEDKGLKLVGGKALVQYLLEELSKSPEAELRIVAHHPAYQAFGYPVIEDIYKEKGPLGGIFTALAHAREDAMVLSVDTPFISGLHLRRLCQNAHAGRITVLQEEDKIYPLCAVYPYRLKDPIESRILEGRLKLFDFLELNDPDKIKVELSELERLNLNTPEDIKTAEKIIKNED